jgi:hypothetical protein
MVACPGRLRPAQAAYVRMLPTFLPLPALQYMACRPLYPSPTSPANPAAHLVDAGDAEVIFWGRGVRRCRAYDEHRVTCSGQSPNLRQTSRVNFMSSM